MKESNSQKQNKNKGNNKNNEDDPNWISIMAHGEINISAQIRDTYFDNKKGAILKYSHNTDEIGITPASIDHTNSYSIKGNYPSIKCESYLKTYELTREEATRHPVTVEDGTIWVDMTTTI